jgi:hypothetical protein
MLRNAASHLGCELNEGDSGTVDRDLGERLVRMGIAVEIESRIKVVKPKESTLKGVSAKPSIAESKPAEIAGDSTVKPLQKPEASS